MAVRKLPEAGTPFCMLANDAANDVDKLDRSELSSKRELRPLDFISFANGSSFD